MNDNTTTTRRRIYLERDVMNWIDHQCKVQGTTSSLLIERLVKDEMAQEGKSLADITVTK